MLRYHLEIIKPRIIIGNIILLIGSFLFSSLPFLNYILLLSTILGLSLVIASSCIFNNLIDVDIDKKMDRTKNRVLVKNNEKPVLIFILGFITGILGIFILGVLVNYLSMLLSIFGFFVYVILYTLLAKKKTIYSTFIGSFSGSLPSIIGYTAVNNTINFFCLLLFITFIFWQMSHFYAIAIYCIDDYKKANIPLFPVIKGTLITKKHIFFYIICFTIFVIIETLLGYFSYIFLLLFFPLNMYWLYTSYLSIYKKNNQKYSKKLFFLSILVVFFFNFLMAIHFIL